MADAFKYLSPRQFQELGEAERDRYLAALYEHLHATPREKYVGTMPAEGVKTSDSGTYGA